MKARFWSGPRVVTDKARQGPVSLATASRALSPGTRNVQAAGRARAMEAAERLGYRPNLTAQATAKGAARTIAVVASDIQDPYYSTIAQGVIDGAADAGLIVTIAGCGPSLMIWPLSGPYAGSARR